MAVLLLYIGKRSIHLFQLELHKQNSIRTLQMADNENQSCNTSSSSSSHDPVLSWKTPTLQKVNERTQAFRAWYESSDIIRPIHSTPSTKFTKFLKVVDMSRDQVLEKIETYKKEIKDEGPDKLLDQSASNTRLVGTNEGY